MNRDEGVATLRDRMVNVASPQSALPQGRHARRGSTHRLTGWVFTGPFVLVFAFAFIAPIIYSIYISLFQEKLIGGTVFAGFDNYLRAATDERFWAGFFNVVLFMLVMVPAIIVISLVLALAIDSGRLAAVRIFRLSIFLPYAVPAVVAVIMWGFLYGSSFGLVGGLEKWLGADLPDPLSSNLILVAIGNIQMWQFVGYNMLIVYSALRVVPTELYEAAAIDGAGAFRIIWSVKIPAIRNAIAISTVFSVIGAFQLFNEPQILQPLAPNSLPSYFTPSMYAYNLSFKGLEFNYSATVAIIMGVLTMIVAYVVQLSGTRKEKLR